MKCKATGKQLVWGFGLVVVSTVFVTMLCFSSASSQEPKESKCSGSHSRRDFYKNVRMLPPALVLEINVNRVNYAVTEEGIELGSLDLEPGYSIVPKDFTREHHDGCYGISYCEKHLVILKVEDISKGQCGSVNKQ